MDARSAMREMKKGIFRPLYICYGQEPFLMEQFVKFTVETCIAPDLMDLALSRSDLRETPLASVIEDAETAPFLVERKVVIAENALFLTGLRDTSKVEHDLERFAEYLKAPVEHTTLIFLVHTDKLDARKKIVKTLKSMDVLIPFSPMQPTELVQWIIKNARKKGVTIQEAAAERILFNTGANLQQISSELEKCCLYAGEGGEIHIFDVDQLVPKTVEQNVFLLIEHVVHRRHEEALALLYDLLQQREEPIKIIALIVRQFRMVMQAKMLGGQGFTQQQMASRLGVHPYAAKLAYEQSRHYKEAELGKILNEVAELDYQIKTGQVDKVMGLELLLLKLAG